MKLRVEEADWDDIFSDMVRIPGDYRRHPNGEKIENGNVVRIEHDGKHVFAVGRGLPGRNDAPMIYMDEVTSRKLGIRRGSEIESANIREATRREQLRWYRHASNPAARVAAEVATLSLWLGALSVVLGLIGVGIAICA
ncbi:hypothetical protein [Mesorhizobium sp. M0998]|uniref:hypothetical protein n=1 Tax=Mesorhizobium sp. M0998 TaxID=2957044 RepID=UPI00333D7A43